MIEQKTIKKMSKKDLLEILVLQSKKIDELQEKIDKLSKELNDRQIMISESGSIAEAALKLNKVFEIAQQAANQYLDSIKIKSIKES